MGDNKYECIVSSNSFRFDCRVQHRGPCGTEPSLLSEAVLYPTIHPRPPRRNGASNTYSTTNRRLCLKDSFDIIPIIEYSRQQIYSSMFKSRVCENSLNIGQSQLI